MLSKASCSHLRIECKICFICLQCLQPYYFSIFRNLLEKELLILARTLNVFICFKVLQFLFAFHWSAVKLLLLQLVQTFPPVFLYQYSASNYHDKIWYNYSISLKVLRFIVIWWSWNSGCCKAYIMMQHSVACILFLYFP